MQVIKTPDRIWLDNTRDEETKQKKKKWKTINGYDNIDISVLELTEIRRPRGHEVVLIIEQCRLYIRKY